MIETCVIIVIMLVKYDKCLYPLQMQCVTKLCVCAVADLGVFAEIIYTRIENDDINTYKSSIYFTDDPH